MHYSRMRTTHTLPYGGSPSQKLPWTETNVLDRDPPPGQRPPPPGQIPPPPGQRPPPPGQRPPPPGQRPTPLWTDKHL